MKSQHSSRTMQLELFLDDSPVPASIQGKGKLVLSSPEGRLTFKITRKQYDQQHDRNKAIVSVSAVSDRTIFGGRSILIQPLETVEEFFDLAQFGDKCTFTVTLSFLSFRSHFVNLHWTKEEAALGLSVEDTIVQ